MIERDADEGDGDEPVLRNGVRFPDVDVVTAEPGWATGPGGATTLTPATARVSAPAAYRWKLVTVEVRDVDRGELVAAIEVLSPVNKRRPGLLDYRRKRKEYWQKGAHLLEVDLLRRGTRPFRGSGDAAGTVLRVPHHPAGTRAVDVWAMSIRDRLPTVPVPLLKGDGPAAVDLGAAFADAYDAAGYDLQIDYAADPPPPEFAADDRAWIAALLADRRGNQK